MLPGQIDVGSRRVASRICLEEGDRPATDRISWGAQPYWSDWRSFGENGDVRVGTEAPDIWHSFELLAGDPVFPVAFDTQKVRQGWLTIPEVIDRRLSPPNKFDILKAFSLTSVFCDFADGRAWHLAYRAQLRMKWFEKCSELLRH